MANGRTFRSKSIRFLFICPTNSMFLVFQIIVDQIPSIVSSAHCLQCPSPLFLSVTTMQDKLTACVLHSRLSFVPVGGGVWRCQRVNIFHCWRFSWKKTILGRNFLKWALVCHDVKARVSCLALVLPTAITARGEARPQLPPARQRKVHGKFFLVCGDSGASSNKIKQTNKQQQQQQQQFRYADKADATCKCKWKKLVQ